MLTEGLSQMIIYNKLNICYLTAGKYKGTVDSPKNAVYLLGFSYFLLT